MQDWSAKLFRSNWSQERYNCSVKIFNTSGCFSLPKVFWWSLIFLKFKIWTLNERLCNNSDTHLLYYSDDELLHNAVCISYAAYDINHLTNGHKSRDKPARSSKIGDWRICRYPSNYFGSSSKWYYNPNKVWLEVFFFVITCGQ